MDDHYPLISGLLAAHQSAFIVYPTFLAAKVHFDEFLDRYPLPPTEQVIRNNYRLAIMRQNPQARQTKDQTFVTLVSADSDPYQVRGTKAVVEIPFYLPYLHRHRDQWIETQKIQERHRVKS